jgi:predicted nucleotidyltransferase
MLEPNADRCERHDRRVSHASGTDNVAQAARPIAVGVDRFGNRGRLGARKRAGYNQGAGIGGADRRSRTRWLVHYPKAGQSFSIATAAKPITRATAEKALQQFFDRVEQVNEDPYFLGKVTRLVLFGSLLKPEVERLSDVDLAVELTSKEADLDRARARNYERVEDLTGRGHRFRNFMEQEFCWYWEAFGYLKGRSRVIALADYAAEKAFVLTVPHRFLIGQPEELTVHSAASTPGPTKGKRRPRDCPF